MEKIDPELIKKWSQIEPSDAVFLPTKNEFIPDNFDLVPPPESPMDVPVIIKVGSMHVTPHPLDTGTLTRLCISSVNMH